MDQSGILECAGFYFIHNFDSGNLGHVERVPTELISSSINHKTNTLEKPDYEFNLWTRPDCAGTEFENGNRTWFYFGVQAKETHVLVRLNLVNLNKQGKMYTQGMAPVTRTLPGRPHWERIRDRPVHSMDDNTFTLSFKYRTPDNLKATTFFAFTYPYSYAELLICLNSIDSRMLPLPMTPSPDDIYYCRECLVYSLEGRRVELLTISSHHNITTEREERLKNLFPTVQERPYKFNNKKVIFISARVHPGETPSSFVFNGFLNLILTRNDPVAMQLRKLYVFKMIPFLNPDGVARGHYRTDTRGVNLNRVYLNPSLVYHPTVYASRALIRYYHYGCEKEDTFDDNKSYISSAHNLSESVEMVEVKKRKEHSASVKTGAAKPDKSNKALLAKQSNVLVNDSCEGGIEAGEASNLAAQVCDMNLQEKSSQSSINTIKDANGNPPASSSILTDEILKSYLGSSVHVSTSEELNIEGGNPLQPLRDTLKNTISLLMGANSMTAWEGARPGRCIECRRAEEQFANTTPEVTYTVMRPENSFCNSIQKYREQQLIHMESEDKKLDAKSKEKGEVCFCTNCFKRYMSSEFYEEVEVQLASDDLKSADASVDVATGEMSSITPFQSKDGKPNTSLNKPQKKKPTHPQNSPVKNLSKDSESGLFLYVDLHGHASKKGIFMYGNYFEDTEKSVECMLLPRIMALNNVHFHFTSCNFTERNMYLKDRRDGMSREGSGRVAVLKATGLVRSYTLECNYNTGRLVNALPPAARETQAPAAPLTPPYYTPHIYEEVGWSLGSSILDLTAQHPDSRIPGSEHRTLAALRDSLRALARPLRTQLTMSRLRPKTSSPSRLPLFSRKKTPEDKKENTYGTKSDSERKNSPPILAVRLGNDSKANVKFSRKTEPTKSSTRAKYLSDNEPKPKSLSAKRRNAIAIRKPNASKPQMSGVVKIKVAKKHVENASDSKLAVAKLSKRSMNRLRTAIRSDKCRSIASSSSEDLVSVNWENVVGGTVLNSSAVAVNSDSFPARNKRKPVLKSSPSRLKKIRLKTGL